MDKLEKLKVEKFRILNNSELKEITGGVNFCYGVGGMATCNGTCETRGGYWDNGWNLGGFYTAECKYDGYWGCSCGEWG